MYKYSVFVLFEIFMMMGALLQMVNGASIFEIPIGANIFSLSNAGVLSLLCASCGTVRFEPSP